MCGHLSRIKGVAGNCFTIAPTVSVMGMLVVVLTQVVVGLMVYGDAEKVCGICDGGDDGKA